MSRPRSNSFIRYSAMATQMAVIIGASVWGGLKLDESFSTRPIFVVILSLVGVSAAMYFVIKDLIKK